MRILKRLFGTDGVRGLVNEELSVEISMKISNAVARMFSGKYNTLLIASDTRNSKEMLEYALTAGALSAGMDVEYCGVMPTPTLAYLTKEKATVGIMISASHNPASYNGLKVLKEGFKISDETEIDVEKLVLEGEMDYVPYGEVGKIKKDDLKNIYIDYIVKNFKNINYKGKIAVDVGNGAAGAVINEIFSSLNLDYDVFYNEPDGFNINENCGSTQPDKLSHIVIENKYDLGILYDGDADRCLFIDKNGMLVDGDKLIAINALKLKKQGRLKNDSVVTTVMSNLGFEKFLNDNEINLLRTNVGDKYVLEKMMEKKIVIGGEQSGHIIFFDKSTTGDGILTSLETLESITLKNKDIHEIVEEIPNYPQVLKNISVKNKIEIMQNEKIKKLKEKFESQENLRVVLRASGTEHKIRVMVEGKDEKLVEKVANEFCEEIEYIENSI